jgi:crotonobetainyl-CoA:carnitine CoA-transferase CaiB-like acyl-CoA transferase
MLSPYRVLDLTDDRGDLCGRILADLGADVISVEPPGGSPARQLGPFAGDRRDPEHSLHWWAYARNKRSITLDLITQSGRERLCELVGKVDFLIESYPPGYLDSLGLGYRALAALNPRLVVVSITPFGQSGPKAQWAASDITLMAASGVLQMMGDDDRPPCRLSLPQAQLHAGSEAAVAALIAHAARERDGLGQHVDVSTQTAIMMAAQSAILSHGWNDSPTTRISGGAKVGPFVLKLVQPASDGYVSILFSFGSAVGAFTHRLMGIMNEEGIVDEATRDKDWLNYFALLVSGEEPMSELTRCNEAIGEWTRRHTKEELFRIAMERGLLLVPVLTTAELISSPQLETRDFWIPVESIDGGSYLHPGPFAKLAATPLRSRCRAPLVGEHDAEVQAELAAEPVRTGPAPLIRGTRQLPLEGIKVLEFMWVMAGPMSLRYLADYGATVVHVETTTRADTARTSGPFKDNIPGPERSGLTANVNAGKLGLTLNLKTSEGLAIARRLVQWADVVAESYSPGTMTGWGLDYESLRRQKRDLIMVSSCLNGQTGPHAGLAGFGTMGAQLAGFGMLGGWPDRPPAGPWWAYTDYVAPKFTAAAILAALDHRRRTGQGQYIDLSQVEAAAHFLTPALLDYTVNGRVADRCGNSDPDHAPHGVYPVSGDDRWVAIACRTESQWEGLCDAIGRPEWKTDQRFATFAARKDNELALDELLSAWTRLREAGEVETLLQARHVPCHRLSWSADIFADVQLAHRHHLVTVPHPEIGAIPIEGSRFLLSSTPALVTRPGPTFGQDNDYVLRELLGMNDDEITAAVVMGALD